MSKIYYIVNEEKRSLELARTRSVFVEGDKFIDSVEIWFPEGFTDMNLDTSLVRVMYKTPAESEVQRAALTSFYNVDEGYRAYTWNLNTLTDVSGSVFFALCLLDLEADGQTVEYEWHTTPVSFTIVSTIHGETDAVVPPDVEAAIETQIQALRAEVSSLTHKINNVNGGLPTPVSLASEMVDISRLYLYTGSETGMQHGYWYYYDRENFEWTAGAQYGAHDFDSVLDETSTNPVQNKVIKAALDQIEGAIPEIDDTLAQSGKAADAKKTGDEIASLKEDLNATETAMEVLNLRGAKVYPSTASAPDLDIADDAGNVLIRLQNGHILTKGFDSEIVTEEVSKSAKQMDSEDGDADLYISDEYGNVVACIKGGGIQTKSFKGFKYLLFRSASVQYTGDACTISISQKFHAGDRIVLHVERGGASWSTGAVVTYKADNATLFDNVQADCAWLEYTLTDDCDVITAEYSASATGLTSGTNLVFEVYLLGDVPIQPTIIRVKKDGTGDFTTLRGALDSIGETADDVIHPVRIEVFPGTYDVMDDYTDEEIGSAYYSHVSNRFVGPKLYNGVHLVGMGGNAGDVVINAVLSATDWTQELRNVISTINMQGSCSVENVTIRGENIRYCIHADFRHVYGKPVKQVMKKVVLKGYELAYAPNSVTYGGGIQRCGGEYLFEDVDFGLDMTLHTYSLSGFISNPTAIFRHCKGINLKAGDANPSTDAKNIAEYILDGCDFTRILSSKGSGADQTLPHILFRGTCGSSPMYDVDILTLYDTGDVEHSYKISDAMGTVLEKYLTTGSYWRKTTDPKKASGIIVHQTDGDTYVQKKGYVRTDRLGLSSFALYDYIGIDANSMPVIVQSADDAIGQITVTNSAGTIGFMKMRG